MNLNIIIEKKTHEDLKFVQDYYSRKMGVKLSQAQTIRKLLYETAMIIKNTGESYPGRDWTFERINDE